MKWTSFALIKWASCRHFIHRPWGIKPCFAQETCPWTWKMTVYNAGFPVYTRLVSHKEMTQYMRQCILQTVGSLQRMAITCHTIRFRETCLPNDFEPIFFSVGALYMAKHFIEWNLPFKKGFFAAARAFYRKKISAEHFIESWDASPKSLYRTELSSKPFYKGWTWTGPVYTEGGAARNDVINPLNTAELSSKPFYKGWTWTGPVYTEGGAARNDVINPLYTAELLANHFIKDGHGPGQFIQRVGLPEMT